MDSAGNRPYDPEKKWGEKLIRDGYCIVPDRVIKNWSATGLDATDLALVVNLAAYWWSAERLPYPSAAALAKNLGLSKRSVERRIKKMVEMKFLTRRVAKVAYENAPKVKEYDLSGLIRFFEKAV